MAIELVLLVSFNDIFNVEKCCGLEIEDTGHERHPVNTTFKTCCTPAAAMICLHPSLQVETRYTSCTHMDMSKLLYVHVGLPVEPTELAW